MNFFDERPSANGAWLERAKWFVFAHFESLLVLLLVGSLIAIQWLIDYKVAFLSFYYLPVIIAGFQLGRRGAVWSAVLIVLLIAFVQAVSGLGDVAGLDRETILVLVPWGGFLVLTGYAVGTLADRSKARADDVRGSYMSMLELLTFHLEASERLTQGHSFRVAERSAALGSALGMREAEIEQMRVAALLHELGPQDPRVLRLFEQFPGDMKTLPVAESMRAALDIVREYGRYHEHVGADFPVDALRIPLGVKILAVADAFETLQMPSANRPAFSPWAAVEEIERGAGQTFGSEVVTVLRKIAGTPEPVAAPIAALSIFRERAVNR